METLQGPLFLSETSQRRETQDAGNSPKHGVWWGVGRGTRVLAEGGTAEQSRCEGRGAGLLGQSEKCSLQGDPAWSLWDQALAPGVSQSCGAWQKEHWKEEKPWVWARYNPTLQRCSLSPWSSCRAEVGQVGSGNAPFREP